MGAGAPTQAKIIPSAFKIHKDDPIQFDTLRFAEFTEFLKNQLNVSEDRFPDIAIEDIFTPLDRCLSDSSQYRGISLDQIMRIRESVFYVIGRTIQILLNNPGHSKGYIKDFARYITDISSQRADINYRKTDPVSVLSTNWDILLDNLIYQNIQDNNHKAVVDYCCYISSLDEHDMSVKPGLEKLGEGGFNVKLLKLHGSLNWLQCPRCARLYTRFQGKDSIDNFLNPTSCRHCDRNFSEEAGNHVLAANLIMPTFIKDLSNPQYKLIWQNAGIEISEADNLVFIGYSLPSADFEMRQLLSRMTRKNAKIDVVDFCDVADSQSAIRLHWESFFGNREIDFFFSGAEAYVNTLISKD